MSIIDAFDMNGEEIIKAESLIEKTENFPKTVIVAFDMLMCDLFRKRFGANEVGALNAAGQKLPVYQFVHKGVRLGFFRTLLGGACTAGLLEELIASGAEKVLFFGSCGALVRDIAEGNLIVPTAAYRDEGVSYHYAKASDYLEIETAQKLMRILEDIHVPYRPTKTWTTDALYRETKLNAEKRRNEGCGVVEMECASVMAVGQFRRKEVYQFLYAADCLDGKDWDKRILGNMPADLGERILLVAIEAAIRL